MTETKADAVFKAFKALEKASKIEKRINWNNDAERDSKIGDLNKALFDAMWYSVAATYRR